jgi:sialate O-acetylesterase
VPVGLINSSWGGPPAEVWTPANAVINNDTLQTAAMKLNVSPWWPTKPGKAYNAMIAPLLPFRIAGALWYQGESNTGTADTYESLLTGMIDNWRKGWNQNFPFYFVQIAPYTYGNKNIGALLREAQSNAEAHPKTGMVVITDLVEDIKDIHPRQKNAVAVRLANYALTDHYSRTGFNYRSPVFKSMSVKGNQALLTFDHAENGFITRGGKAVEWFVAGEDKVFYPADISMSKNIITVSSPKVRIPVAVRFGFSNEAIGNIFNKEGLPVNPFRTDNWQVDTSKIN